MRVGVYPTQLSLAASSPAACALQARLEALRQDTAGVELVALYSGDIVEEFAALFDEVHVEESSGKGLAGIWFDHKRLPELARRADVDLLWLVGRGAPLRSPVPVALELLPMRAGQPQAPTEQLRRSMAEAGAAGARLRYAWSDMDFERDRLTPQQRLQPFVNDAFRVTPAPNDTEILMELDLPPAYVLAHMDESQSIDWLLAAWSWVDASVGDQIPLVIAGLAPERLTSMADEIRRLNLENSVHIADDLRCHQLAPLYRGCQAFLQAGSSQTGQELRWALATGAPIASFELPLVSGIAGEAAYLTPPGDARALGAACLTLLVEPKEMAEPLRQKGLMRAKEFHREEVVQRWRKALFAAADEQGG